MKARRRPAGTSNPFRIRNGGKPGRRRGNPLTMTDENGHTTSYEYDHAGNLVKTTFPTTPPAAAPFTTRTYDELTFAAPSTFPFCSTPGFIALGDLNGDGKLDIAVTTPDGVSVLFNSTR